MSPRRPSPAVVRAALITLVLHTITVLWSWRTWGFIGRYGLLDWIDFPVSLLYLELEGARFLACSLLLGGLQWTVIGGLLAYHLGRTVRRRKA